jgi:chemotaxis protein CheC
MEDLQEIHLDVLKEIGNIGAGNALTALSKLVNEGFDMSVARVAQVEFKDISHSIGGEDQVVIGIIANITGDVDGMVMFIINKESGEFLINSLLYSEDKTFESEFNEMEYSALKEVGNILNASYLGSLATLMNKKLEPSVPYLAIDMANAVLSVPAIEFGKVSDKAIFIESLFEARNKKTSGFFILIPDKDSYNTILSSLGVKLI